MKQEVLQSLLTAKVLLNKAQDLCFVDDRYTASAGLIILQDALELVFLSILIEKSVDEKKSIESFAFDQLIGELKKEGLNVIKSGTLKALNKQRVVIKHYGQISEPQTANNYYEISLQAINSLMNQVFDKKLDEIMLHELIRNTETRQYLSDASEALDQEKYFKCLVNVRKAIFIEIERDYCIYEWRDETVFGALGFALLGCKAPYYARSKKWIEENVRTPFDYIQRDHGQIRQDLLEWGASTQDFWNIWRLTPEVIQLDDKGEWLLKGELKHLYRGATIDNAIFCLDRAITLLSKKQAHNDLARWLSYSTEDYIKIRLKVNSPLYEKASRDSKQIMMLSKENEYLADSFVPGLDGNDRFIHLSSTQNEDPKFIYGFVLSGDCDVLEDEK